MRKFTLLFALCVVSFVYCFAQEVSIKKEVVLIDKNEYCLIKDESKNIFNTNFTILNLNGDELFYVKLSMNTITDNPNVSQQDRTYNFYVLVNMQTQEEVELDITDLTFKKTLMKHFFQNKVLAEDMTVSEEGFQKFRLKYACKCSEKLAMKMSKANNTVIIAGGGGNTPLVNRNRSAMIMVFGKEIKQANALIGTYTRSQTATGGDVQVRYTIYDAYNNLVAEATCSAFNAKSAQVTTIKDNRTQTVSFSFSTDMEVVKAIAHLLVDRMYL